MLDIFGTDPEESRGGAHRETRVSVADVCARRVQVEWFEAIAIAQGASKYILDSGDETGPAAIPPANVFLGPSGDVNVQSSGPKDAAGAIRAMADLVRLLLPDDNVPAPLRLAISQASVCTSLADFSRSLEFFERPNRPALIQAVYQKWKAAALQTAATGVPLEQRPEPVPHAKVAAARAPFPIKRVVHIGLMIAGAAAIAAAVWLWQNSTVRDVGSAASATGNLVQRATSAVDSVIDRILPPAPEKTVVESLGSDPAPDNAPRAPRSTRVPATVKPVTPGVSGEISALAAKITAFDLKEPPAAAPSPPVPLAQTPNADTSDDGKEASPRIFSEGDTEVAPPVAVYPQLPSSLPPGTPSRDLAVIEVVIDRFGKVESAKVRQAPATMADAMILTMSLSAAKTWRFEPATKDGQPVRYRKSIWILTR